MKHVVIGSGSAPATAISESLRDLIKDGDELAFAWTGSPVPEGYEAVYGYALDNEIPFTMLYTDGQKIPGVFRDSEFGVVQKVRDTEQSLLKNLDGKVLLMWEDSENEEGGLIDRIFDSCPNVEVLELTNGLAPIVIESEVGEPEPEPVTTDDDDDMDFTQEQLSSMAPAAVVRYGQRKGCTATTKAGVIEELFGSKEVTEEPAPVVVVDGTSFPSKMPEHTSNPNWDQELTILINNFMQFHEPGFEADMAHLTLGQARLWMLKSLARVKD
jgi:hypothetical protein